MSKLNELLVDIASERLRQDELFGDQTGLPDVTGPGNGGSWMTEGDAKKLCELAKSNGTCSWTHLTVEELAEVINAPDDKSRIEELIQLAALCVNWAEKIHARTS